MAQIRQLRIVATLLFAFAVAQAGLGSGYLDGVRPLLIAHATNAFAVLVLAVQVVVGNPYLALGAFALLALPGVFVASRLPSHGGTHRDDETAASLDAAR